MSRHAGSECFRSRRDLLPLAAALLACVLALPGCAESSAADTPPEPEWAPSFVDRFDRSEVITETTSAERSTSTSWWLESGAFFNVSNGAAATLEGDAPAGYLRARYAERKARDTDGGRHPQNLFRLLTCETWDGSIEQTCGFRVLDYHPSDSPQRTGANGVLLFSRYADPNNLYYAGVRVDGHAVIKKKSAGVYYTLAELPLFKGRFDRDSHPIVLPTGRWIRLRSVITDDEDGSVTIRLYVISDEADPERLVLTGIDAGVGGPAFRSGRTGIRTDFMDVEFRDYAVSTAR